MLVSDLYWYCVRCFSSGLDGGLQAEVLLPVIIFNGLATPFLLALIHLLDNQAVTSLNSMRPTLEMTEPEFDKLARR